MAPDDRPCARLDSSCDEARGRPSRCPIEDLHTAGAPATMRLRLRAHQASCSWRTAGTKDLDRGRTDTAYIIGVDFGHRRNKQADRFGALRKISRLACLDEGKSAIASAQEISGPGSVRQTCRRTCEKHQARLMESRRCCTRISASTCSQNVGKCDAWEYRGQCWHDPAKNSHYQQD